MKIVFICPSNMLYMPYVRSYISIVETLNIDYKIINWNRLGVSEKIDGYTFEDKKTSHQRSYLDYLKYKRFVIDKLKKEKFDKIIVFTLQLGHLFKKYLINKLPGNYILDIRDYNKIFMFSNFKHLIDCSHSCVISSPGYKEWLPESNKYVINHNTIVSSLDELVSTNEFKVNEKTNILTIGLLRHWDVNIDFVNQLKNNNKYNLIFHGEGTINDRLKNYIKDWEINNTKLFGRYKKEEEENIYKSTDLVNTLLYNDNINSRTLLANRLYNSVLYGKPMLALKGTYQAEIIKQYNIGLVVSSLDDLDKQIDEYLDTFSCEDYNRGRIEFFKTIIKENELFESTVREFLC